MESPNKGTASRQIASPDTAATRAGPSEDIRSRLERKSQDKVQRLKLASRPSKVNVITCSDIFDSLPAASSESRRHHALNSEKGPFRKKNKITVRPSSSSKNSASGRRGSRPQSIHHSDDDDASPIKMQESEARQLKMIESSELAFDDLSCSQRATCNSSTDTMNNCELSDFEYDETKASKYQGTLMDQEEGLKESSQPKEKQGIRALDATTRKLEETKKKRRLLEAITDSLKEEQLKLEEKKKQQTLEAQQQQQGKQKLQIKHKASPSSVNPPKPYPKSMLRQPPSPTQPKQKSVTIREDLSIIQNMDDCTVECGLCGPGECVCSGEEEGPIDVSDSVTSTGGGLTRTDTFHNIFEERKYNISRRDLIHSTGSRSLPAIHPSGKQKDTVAGIKTTLEDFDLRNIGISRADSVSNDEDETLSDTAENFITNVLANASNVYHKSVKKVPRDSLTIKNSCKRHSSKD